MAYSFVQLPGDGSNQNFPFTFGYLSKSHISAKVDGVSVTFTWLTDFSIQIDPAPAAGTIVEVRRTTPLDQPAVVWTDGSTLTEQDMNQEARFNLYIAQEARDLADVSLQLDSEGVWDGRSRSTTNFADPTGPTGLVTKNFLDNTYTTDIDAKVAAAAASATASANSASASQGYATAADESSDLAAQLLSIFKGQYYGPLSSDPTVDPNGNPVGVGDLYFNTTAKAMRVYTGAGWQNAGSTVQGVINKPVTPVIATEGQTSVLIPGGYDPNFIITFVNGVGISSPAVDVSSGTDIIFDDPLSAGDEVMWVAFGAFEAANAIPADGSVTDSKVAPNADIAATKLTFLQDGTGAVARSVESKLRDRLNICDFGAIPNGGDAAATANTAALAAAVSAATAKGGARIVAPAGVFKFNGGQQLWPNSSGWHNLVIEGDGAGSTVFDFSLCPSGTNGFDVMGWGGRVGFRGLTIQNAPGIGIDWNHNNEWVSRIFAEDVIVDGCGSHGFRFFQNYMGHFIGLESRNNALTGFMLENTFTSMTFIRCWAGGDAARPNGGNEGIGWDICGLSYSSLIGCGSDWNALGFRILSSNSTTLVSCGCESNDQEGFFITSTTPQGSQGVRGVVLENCFAFNNAKAGLGTYSNFLAVSTGSGVPVSVETRGCIDMNTDGSPISLVLAGTSGTINYTDSGSSLVGTLAKSGSVNFQNNTVSGKSTMVALSANQAITTSVDVVVAFNTTVSNRLGASLSGGTIIIPPMVNRIKVSAGVYWDNNSSGARFVQIKKNGVSVAGLPAQKTMGNAFTQQSVNSAIIEVSPADTISVTVNQTSAGDLNVISNPLTFLSVEAIG